MGKAVRTVLITGGGGGIGREAALKFQRAGYRVLISDINEEAAAATAQSVRAKGGEAESYAVDIADRDAVFALAEAIHATHGYVDVLVNNAGIGHHGLLRETTVETWRQLLEVNLLGTIHHVDAFSPAMVARGAGVIVNVSSGQAFFKLPTWGAYAAVKAALGVYSEVLHFELRGAGVHVATVYPFMVNTGFYDHVAGNTAGHRLAMAALPLYSVSPERIAAHILKAVRRRRRVDLTHASNHLARWWQHVPGAGTLVGRASLAFLNAGGPK